MADLQIPTKLEDIRNGVKKLLSGRQKPWENNNVDIVAMSKTRTKEDIIEAYSGNQRHFGEGQVSELLQKATDPEILSACPDIKWHFIGDLPEKDVKTLLSTPNLFMIQTIDCIKLADSVDSSWGELEKPERLKIMIQVNISDKMMKKGASLYELHFIIQHIVELCKNLEFCGLMMYGGAPGDKADLPAFTYFLDMVDLKKIVCKEFKIYLQNFSLSMGTSDDYQFAVRLGSNYVRLGTAIFGPRAQ